VTTVQKRYIQPKAKDQYREQQNKRTDAAMQSSDLTNAQARALKNKIHPMLGYLGRLKRRMVRRGFLNDDPLLAAVVKAEDAMHAMHVETHYLSCGDKVARRQ
jgi:hypothetical protein